MAQSSDMATRAPNSTVSSKISCKASYFAKHHFIATELAMSGSKAVTSVSTLTDMLDKLSDIGAQLEVMEPGER
jgi:hypothetical protein